VNVYPAKSCLNSIDVLVLAGGLGTRIRPVLGDTPKLLAPIAGRTYLDHLLGWLAGFGARRVVLALGYRAEAILDHLARHAPQKVAIETVVEPKQLGTAGAVRWARSELHSDPVLIINGDSFADVDLCKFLGRHCHAGAVGTILCAKVADAGRYGRVQIDNRGAVAGFVEKSARGPGLGLEWDGKAVARFRFEVRRSNDAPSVRFGSLTAARTIYPARQLGPW
jgi:NDP-sugar pyrophosphorylase family protein